MKKIFMSPFFVPVAFLLLWTAFMGVVYYGFPADAYRVTEDGQLIEIVTHTGYILMIAALLYFCNDYKENILSWGIFLFLSMCAFLREGGIQHHLSKTDTTPFKSRFFLNPNNPLGEKIVYGLILLVILASVLYLAIKYSKHLVLSFFKMNTVTWSIATMCTIGVFAKWIDRFPSGYRKAHGVLPEDLHVICSLLEESSEMFLPYIVIAILAQYHLRNKDA